MQIVAELQRELVFARLELRVNRIVASAEVHPRRRALHDGRSSRQTILIDPEMMMADACAHSFGSHCALRHRLNMIAIDAEYQMHRALHGGAVFRLDEVNACSGRCRLRYLRRSENRVWCDRTVSCGVIVK